MLLRCTTLALTLAGGVAAQEADVPDCADAPAMTTCAMVAEGVLLAFVFAPVDDGAVLQISQSAPDGGDIRSSDPIRVKGVGQSPSLYDLDGDGRAEVFVPVSMSESRTAYDIWRRDEGGYYDPVDTVTADTPDAFVPSGDLVIHSSQSAPGVWTESSFVFDANGLTLLYAVQMDANAQACTMMLGRQIFNEAIILADCEARLSETDLEEESQ